MMSSKAGGRVRWRAVLAALACVIAGASRAASAPDDPDKARVTAVLDKWHCPITEYLERIRHFHDPAQNRYLILWPHRDPDAYVQCAYDDNTDRRVVCEAASGFYAEGTRDFGTPDALRALARLGFSTDGSKGNFQQYRPFHGSAELATMMLETLARVFDLDRDDVLEYSAPFLSPSLTNRVAPGRDCALISRL